MPRRTPTVVDGLRKPIDRSGADPEQQASSIAAARAALTVPKAEGEVVYQSVTAGHRIQLMSPFTLTDPMTGAKEYKRGLVAQFKDNEFRTKDPVVIAKLDAHRNYGLRKDFWRAEEGRAEALESAVQGLIATVKVVADPETARRLIRELAPMAGGDFELPKPPQATEAEGDDAN